MVGSDDKGCAWCDCKNGSFPTIAYLRVSTQKQDLEKNKADILRLANDKKLGHVEWVEEKASGRVSWRKRELGRLLEELEMGDNLIVSELSRLGRSMLQCMEILSIATDRGVHVYAVKGNWQLDDSLQSKILAMAFTMAAEIERDLISQRTKEALAARKRSGKPISRPKGAAKANLMSIGVKLRGYSLKDPHKNILLTALIRRRQI